LSENHVPKIGVQFIKGLVLGKNLSDDAVLTELWNNIGLTNAQVKEALIIPVFQHQVETDGAGIILR
jgi:predicted DsbA family dithiol-disulfide isomerase